VGIVLEVDPYRSETVDPRFCMAIDLSKGYVSRLLVANIDGEFSEVIIKYEILDTSYHRCPGFTHENFVCPR